MSDTQELAAVQRETDRIASAEREAAARVERDKARAKAEIAAEARRKAMNRKHMAAVNNRAAESIVKILVSIATFNSSASDEYVARTVIGAIAKGEIPGVSIKYN